MLSSYLSYVAALKESYIIEGLMCLDVAWHVHQQSGVCLGHVDELKENRPLIVCT